MSVGDIGYKTEHQEEQVKELKVSQTMEVLVDDKIVKKYVIIGIRKTLRNKQKL